ncbi:MAG: ABC transporter substrate-binding protein [candidate division NC10 bacterium]|nr:ABC transporter substrate-binding protein [candidate division NC10 bacterium]
MKRFIVCWVSLLMVLAVGMHAEAQPPIKVGLITPLTGDVKTFGESIKNGFELAVSEANAKGGILGRKIVPVITDDKNDPTEASNAANKLISQDRVKLIVGSCTSKCTIPVSDICQSQQAVMVTPSATNPKVTVADGKRKSFAFRACFIDPFQGSVMAKFAARTLKKKTAAVLYDVGNDYTKGLAEFFRDAFVKEGGKITGFESYSKDDVDFSALLTKVGATKPDVLFLPDYYNKVGLIAKQARERGIKSVLLGGDGWDSPDLVKIAGAAVEGGYFSNHYSPEDPRPEVRNFIKKYRDRYGSTPDALATLGYDATIILLNAIERAKGDDPQKVRQALAQTKDLRVVSGRITYDQDGNPIKSAAIIGIVNGQQKYKTTINP